ncbi:hypothetical protein CAF53_12935 [Sphingobium sp. LB126]|uniref:acyl-CoA thioesterase n=1 Tax=Sphingobium sp. LB126 TaxID=1983755 RepID=UPI000C2000E6|nr:acyl-CoA thioesterase domain-containing protein [Sphingobium sp. LB126]PJG49033.1 hypothetical protein CAF53_12935 [Sphingobium sp. LB126]
MAAASSLEPSSREVGVKMLVRLLDVEPSGPGRWKGRRRLGATGRVFGGQVIAQALVAAQKSVSEERQIHSLHAYFMRGGDDNYPIDFQVVSDFDGGSFSNRRVVASQNGQSILNFTASFHRKESGLSHFAPMPDVPMPDIVPDHMEIMRERIQEAPSAVRLMLGEHSPIEFRPITLLPYFSQPAQDPISEFWFRLGCPINAPTTVHQAILAYVSDVALLSTSLLPHGVKPEEIQGASLDHAMWFHDIFDVSEWILHRSHSPWAGRGRGLNFGSFYSLDGRLIASTTQEGLIRIK